MNVGRGAAALTFRRCLATAALPTALAAIAAIALQRAFPAQLGDHGAPGAAVPWLYVPLFTAAVLCAVTAVRFWPLFARGGTGADWIRRLQRGPQGGAGGAILGALAAQLLLTLPLVTVVARALGAPAEARHHLVGQPPPDPLLHRERPELVVALGDPCDTHDVLLRPLAGPPVGGLRPTRVRVTAIGAAPGTPVELAFAETRQLARAPLAATGVTALRLTWLDGNVPLLFADDSVVCIVGEPRSTLGNGLGIAFACLVPTFVALALACLCGTVAALATVSTTVVATLFVGTLGGLGPLGESVLALLRGRWLAAGELAARSALSAGVGSAALLLAALARRRAR